MYHLSYIFSDSQRSDLYLWP